MKICFPVRKENGQDYATLDEMMQVVNDEPHGTWLAGTNLLWHGGIHLSDATTKWSVLAPGKADSAVPVQCMAGGEIVAWRVNQDYLTNIYADHTLQYSSTFVLVKSTCQPDPKNEKSGLDFYTLYMGLAPLSAFEKHKCMIAKTRVTKRKAGNYDSSDNPDTIAQAPQAHGHLDKGKRILILKEATFLNKPVSHQAHSPASEPQPFGLAQELDEHGNVKGDKFWVTMLADYMESDGEAYAHLPAWMKQALAQGAFDCVAKPSAPLTIAAGDAIGFLGKDTDSPGAGNADTSHFVHIEVLSADPRMPDFLTNPAQVTTGRKYIRLNEDGKTYTRNGDTFTENTGALGKDIHRVLPEDRCEPFTDKDNKRWFQVSPQSWMNQDGVQEFSQYSLNELGFTALEQSATSDMAASLCEDWAKQALGEIARQVVPARGLQEKQVAEYYQKTMKRVDADGNGKLSAQELHAALSHPEMNVCDIVARMVVKHDSEWYGNSSDPKWTAYYKNYDKPLLNYSKKWQDDMSWMESVAPFNTGEPVWHMHPVMFLDSLRDDEMDLKWLKVRQGQVTFDAEGNDVEGNRYFSRRVHWPGNDASGVTLGRGYDMGGRSKSNVYNDMISSGVSPDIAGKISQGAGLKGTAAMNFVLNNRESIGYITRFQQNQLFELIYPFYVNRAKSNYAKKTIGASTALPWDSLEQKVKDVLVDFVYQGFSGERPMRSGMNNSRQEMISYIEGSSVISSYENGRHRARYLRGQ